MLERAGRGLAEIIALDLGGPGDIPFALSKLTSASRSEAKSRAKERSAQYEPALRSCVRGRGSNSPGETLGLWRYARVAGLR